MWNSQNVGICSQHLWQYFWRNSNIVADQNSASSAHMQFPCKLLQTCLAVLPEHWVSELSHSDRCCAQQQLFHLPCTTQHQWRRIDCLAPKYWGQGILTAILWRDMYTTIGQSNDILWAQLLELLFWHIQQLRKDFLSVLAQLWSSPFCGARRAT